MCVFVPCNVFKLDLVPRLFSSCSQLSHSTISTNTGYTKTAPRTTGIWPSTPGEPAGHPGRAAHTEPAHSLPFPSTELDASLWLGCG